MNGKDSFKRCRKCGKMIGIIRERAYRKILVDAEAVLVMPDKLGDTFIRIDGTKMEGREVFIDVDSLTGTLPGHEYAYRPHRCGVNPDEV